MVTENFLSTINRYPGVAFSVYGYPELSTFTRDGHNDPYSLQLAINLTSNEWPDKHMTLVNWSCDIDLSLRTYVSSDFIEAQQSAQSKYARPRRSNQYFYTLR